MRELMSPFSDDALGRVMWSVKDNSPCYYSQAGPHGDLVEHGVWTNSGWVVTWTGHIACAKTLCATLVQAGERCILTPTAPGSKPRYVESYREARDEAIASYEEHCRKAREDWQEVLRGEPNGEACE